MMRESEVRLEHAYNSILIIQDVRSLLNTAPIEEYGEWIDKISINVEKISEIIEKTPDQYVPYEWRLMVAGLRILASKATSLTIAKGGKGDIGAERIKYDILYENFQTLLSSDDFKCPDKAKSLYQMIKNEQRSFKELLEFLLLIPLPIIYWQSKELKASSQELDEEDNSISPILRVIVFLDNEPFASPKLLRPNLLYPLMFRVQGLIWPENTLHLRLNLMTTCPQNFFTISKFTLDRPRLDQNMEFSGELSGSIIFNAGQSSLLDDIIFSVYCAFETSGGSLIEVPVIGHNELSIRVTDENLHPLISGNRLLDQHVETLMTKLLKECPKIKGEASDLFNMLQALTRLLATYSQEAIFKGRSIVPESEFQRNVLRDLRFILGQDVQEHTSQAGGFTDIRYHGVIVELKVEKDNGDRNYISQRYSSQSVQYAAVEARQVSIVLVLDLTDKDRPPGDIRNDIILKDTETHGGSDKTKEYPSKTFIFVINGNMKSPSDYSH